MLIEIFAATYNFQTKLIFIPTSVYPSWCGRNFCNFIHHLCCVNQKICEKLCCLRQKIVYSWKLFPSSPFSNVTMEMPHLISATYKVFPVSHFQLPSRQAFLYIYPKNNFYLLFSSSPCEMFSERMSARGEVPLIST